MGQSRQPYSPVDEGPEGPAQPLMAVGLPPTAAQRLLMSSRSSPRLGPAPIADRIAQHQHGIDIVPPPTHPGPFEARFHDHLVGTFDTARANGPAGGLIGGVLHVRLALVQISQFLL